MKTKEYRKKYYQTHKESFKEYKKQFLLKHPEKVRELKDRNDKKRCKLGHVYINKHFEGARAHHIDKTHIIWIPKELHCSTSHNVFTGRNMDKINAKVFKWLDEQSGSIQMNLSNIKVIQ